MTPFRSDEETHADAAERDETLRLLDELDALHEEASAIERESLAESEHDAAPAWEPPAWLTWAVGFALGGALLVYELMV